MRNHIFQVRGGCDVGWNQKNLVRSDFIYLILEHYLRTCFLIPVQTPELAEIPGMFPFFKHHEIIIADLQIRMGSGILLLPEERGYFFNNGIFLYFFRRKRHFQLPLSSYN